MAAMGLNEQAFTVRWIKQAARLEAQNTGLRHPLPIRAVISYFEIYPEVMLRPSAKA